MPYDIFSPHQEKLSSRLETMAKITHGRADDLLGALILASTANIFIAPAMNMNMWLDKTTQDNYKKI